MYDIFKSFKNISSFRTHSAYIIYMLGLKFEGYNRYLCTDTTYFTGKTPCKSPYLLSDYFNEWIICC